MKYLVFKYHKFRVFVISCLIPFLYGLKKETLVVVKMEDKFKKWVKIICLKFIKYRQ